MEFVIDRQYDIAPEIITFSINENRFISFTTSFKFLWFLIAYDLDDTYDISFRIKKVNQAIGSLIFLVIRECEHSY